MLMLKSTPSTSGINDTLLFAFVFVCQLHVELFAPDYYNIIGMFALEMWHVSGVCFTLDLFNYVWGIFCFQLNFILSFGLLKLFSFIIFKLYLFAIIFAFVCWH